MAPLFHSPFVKRPISGSARLAGCCLSVVRTSRFLFIPFSVTHLPLDIRYTAEHLALPEHRHFVPLVIIVPWILHRVATTTLRNYPRDPEAAVSPCGPPPGLFWTRLVLELFDAIVTLAAYRPNVFISRMIREGSTSE